MTPELPLPGLSIRPDRVGVKIHSAPVRSTSHLEIDVNDASIDKIEDIRS
jgi:hypothetical protein